jgi:hypothetical protein
MKRLLCALFGHPDTFLHWGAWRDDSPLPYRIVSECCARCGRVLAQSAHLQELPLR